MPARLAIPSLNNIPRLLRLRTVQVQHRESTQESSSYPWAKHHKSCQSRRFSPNRERLEELRFWHDFHHEGGYRRKRRQLCRRLFVLYLISSAPVSYRLYFCQRKTR